VLWAGLAIPCDGRILERKRSTRDDRNASGQDIAKEAQPMGVPLMLLRFLGLTAAGFALGAGWKLGSHLVDAAMGEKDLFEGRPDSGDTPDDSCDPLWRRRFAKISD
jgi:hypothetical protein